MLLSTTSPCLQGGDHLFTDGRPARRDMGQDLFLRFACDLARSGLTVSLTTIEGAALAVD